MKIHYTKMCVVLTTLLLAMTLGLFAQSTCPALKTYTQGGWGAAPSGNNVGTFLDQNFAANFPAPTYLTIGCTNKLQLTSAAAVRAFLPNGTTPAVLPAGTSINKTKSNFSNVLAGQLVALALNLRFDNNIASFAPATVNLKDQIIAYGPFAGKTVQFLFDNANLIIGGCTGYFPKTLSEYTTAIDNVNRNNDNGGTNLLSFLVCPVKATCTTTNILCKGASTGTMTVSVSGGLAPFTYTWTVPSGYSAIGNVASASGLKAGTYTVSVKDALNQTSTTTCTVTEPATAVSADDAHTDALCYGSSTGSVTLTFSGGTGAFTVSFDGGAYVAKTSPAVYSNLAAGIHTWTVKDANGCTASGSETVGQPTAISANDSHSDVLCYGNATGSVSVSFSGGTAPYTVSFNGGAFAAASSPASYSSLAAGSYNWSVKDANGCTASGSETVAQPNSPVSANSSHSNVLCNGGNTGSVSITFGGGTAPYEVNFNGGGYVAASSVDVHSGLTAGTYTWTVKDANGCTVSGSETVTEPTALVASDEHTDVACYGGSTGSINVSFSGGTAPYSVSFNGGAAATATSPASYSGLAAGSYSWTVTDANGCSQSGSETVGQPSAAVSVILSVTKDSNCEDNICDGSASAAASGGTGAYSYSWVRWTTGGSFATGDQIGGNSLSISSLCSSYYVGVTVTDANGCSASVESLGTVDCIPHDCQPLKTFTQGGWGAVPNGNNPGVYLHANFDAAFPSGVTLGCTNTMSWTSAQAITDWLPSGSTPDALPAGNIINPVSDYNNVLVAQLLAATLNVGFDAYDASFSPNDGSLGGRYFADGAFAGMTVNDVIQWANDAVGGCDMHGHTFAEYNAALTDVNENYDNGNQDLGHLTCTVTVGKGFTPVADVINTKVYPNPARTEANVTFNGKIGQVATIAVYDLSGRILMTQKMPTKNGLNQFRLNVSRLVNQTYAVKVMVGGRSTTSMVVVQH